MSYTAAPEWLSVAMLKDEVRIGQADTSSDASLNRKCAAAADIVVRVVGAVDRETISEVLGVNHCALGTGFVPGAYGGTIVLRRRPVLSVLTFNGEASPYSFNMDDARWGILRLDVDTIFPSGLTHAITYVVGHDPVPAGITEAGLIIATHLWRVTNGGGGLPYAPDDQGFEMIPGSGFALPNRAAQMLRPYGSSLNMPGIS